MTIQSKFCSLDSSGLSAVMALGRLLSAGKVGLTSRTQIDDLLLCVNVYDVRVS